MSTRPLIGVTGPDTRLPVAWWFIRWALNHAGARPLRLTPTRPTPPQPLDGVIISGGDDIDPGLYLPDAPDTAPMDAARDAFEIETLERVLKRDIPILGICRGAQLINVVLGGSLHSDLRRIRIKTSNRRTPFARKTLTLDSDSRLAGILGREKARINSLHHQAISETGDGLRVVGRDLDNIVQAIEHRSHRFLIGVQWHPEYLPLHPEQRAVFKALSKAAAHA